MLMNRNYTDNVADYVLTQNFLPHKYVLQVFLRKLLCISIKYLYYAINMKLMLHYQKIHTFCFMIYK